MIELSIESAKKLTEQLEAYTKAIRLCSDLLDPEALGLSTTAEIRNRAREVLGIGGRE